MNAPTARPALTAGEAVASAFGHHARVAQMTDALVAARPILVSIQHQADHQVERVLGLVDAALNASPMTQVRYGRWSISYEPPPIPTRNCDWHFEHEDYDGAPTHSEDGFSPDKRCGHAASLAQAMAEIDALEEEARS